MDFMATRGCVYKTSSKDSQGGIKVAGLPTGGGAWHVVLRQFNIRDEDALLLTPALDGPGPVYSFGEAGGTAGLVLWCLLGDSGAMAALDAVRGWFDNNRASKTKKTITISAGGRAYKVAINSMMIQDANTDFNIQPVYIGGAIVPPGPQR